MAIFFAIAPGRSIGKNKQFQYVDSLLQVAQKAYNINYSQASHFATIANDVAQKYNYNNGVVQSACMLSLIAANTNADAPIEKLQQLTAQTVPNDTVNLRLLFATISRCWYDLGIYDSSLRYGEKTMLLYDKLNKSIPYGAACLTMAKAYNKLGVHPKALAYYNQAKTVAQYNNDNELMAWSDNILGQVYFGQRLYQQAIDCYTRSIKAFNITQNRNGIVSSLLLLGNVYYKQIKDDSAIYCYTESLQTAIKLGDSTAIAINYSNLSRLYLEHQNPTKAIEFAEKALAAIKPGKHITIEAGTYQQLGDIYGELGQFSKAINYVGKALTTARKTDNKIIAQDSYKSLSELYMAMHQPLLAYNNLLAAFRIKDSIQPVAFNRQLAQMQIQYETEKKEAEIKILKQNELINKLKLSEQQERINKQSVIVISLIILLIATVVAAYFYIRGRRLAEAFKQKEIERKAAEDERQRIAKDIHDELGSGLSKIRFLSELMHNQKDNSEQLNTTIHSISDTSKHIIENMKDLVWAMNPENSTLDNLLARIREYSSEYLEEMPIDLEMDIPEDAPHIPISKEVSRNVFMILKEALQNIVKHTNATEVAISITHTPYFKMDIVDNGQGFDLQKTLNGNGLKNMNARSLAIGADIDFLSTPNKGTAIVLTLKDGLLLS